MANASLAAEGRAGFSSSARRVGRAGIVQSAIIFVIASVAAILSDLTTPLAPSIGFVGAIMIAAMAVFGFLHLRSSDRGHEARFAALILPAALCAYAVFQQNQGPRGQPPAGVIAQAIPALEAVQARTLAASPARKAALAIEATLKARDAAAKVAAIGRIAAVPAAGQREYLYETAVKFGTSSQQQLVVVTLLRQTAGRALPIELQTEDNLTIYQQYLEGSSIRFDSLAPRVRARLKTNKETDVLAGVLSGSTLALTGRASLADANFPLAMTAALGRNLTLTGVFHFAHGVDEPFVIRLT
jgi:hypothetical protein